MARIVVSEFLTLDGVMQAPGDANEDRSGGFDKGDAPAAVAALRGQPGGDIQVIGSGGLVQTLIKHGLVDEYRLMIHPLVLGQGKRLFRDGTENTRLKLVESVPTSTGVLLATYVPA